MKIISISTVKNEADIIESFVRYNLNIVDEMIILDNNSSDETTLILKKLIDEGLSITLFNSDDSYHNQATKMTNLLNKAIYEHDGDIVCLLDADEFIISNDNRHPREVLEEIDNSFYYLAKWVTYVPTIFDNENSKFVPSRITHIRDKNLETFYKAIIPKSIVNSHKVEVEMGNHDLIITDVDRTSLVNRDLNISIAHFPIRSKEQCMSKILNGWPNTIAINTGDKPWSFHWKTIFEKIKENNDISLKDLEEFSKKYAISNSQDEITIYNSPMNLDFCQNIEIKYYFKYNYLNNILDNYVYFAEEIKSLKKELNSLKPTDYEKECIDKLYQLENRHMIGEYSSFNLNQDYNIINKSGLFDEEWYMKKYPQVKYLNINPIMHYLLTWKEEMNDPASFFSTKSYYLFHNDVAKAGMNPFIHYISYGRKENRQIFPSGRDICENNQEHMFNQLSTQQNVTNLRLKVNNGYKINVVFIFYKNYWVYESLYKLFDEDELFNVTLIITPYMANYTYHEIEEYNEIYNQFRNKGFNIIKGYDELTNKTIDLELECSPDIVFYATDWPNGFPSLLQVDNIPQTSLICYVPYSFMISELFNSHTMNSKLIRKAWKFFCPTEFHKQKIITNNINNIDPGKIIVSYYPKLDEMFLNNYNDEDIYWKRTIGNNGKIKKRIIWAPHWTVGKSLLNFSTFESNYEFFYNYAESNTEIEWIFRPHPLLKGAIIDNQLLSKEETEKYYKKWDLLPNARYYSGTDYAPMYKYSDAMITDSSSFIGEYLICNKPGLKLTKDTQSYNDFGNLALNYWYRCDGDDFNAIEQFINNIVLLEQDNMIVKRTEFVKNNLLPPDNLTASEIIFNYIKSNFFKL